MMMMMMRMMRIKRATAAIVAVLALVGRAAVRAAAMVPSRIQTKRGRELVVLMTAARRSARELVGVARARLRSLPRRSKLLGVVPNAGSIVGMVPSTKEAAAVRRQIELRKMTLAPSKLQIVRKGKQQVGGPLRVVQVKPRAHAAFRLEPPPAEESGRCMAMAMRAQVTWIMTMRALSMMVLRGSGHVTVSVLILTVPKFPSRGRVEILVNRGVGLSSTKTEQTVAIIAVPGDAVAASGITAGAAAVAAMCATVAVCTQTAVAAEAVAVAVLAELLTAASTLEAMAVLTMEGVTQAIAAVKRGSTVASMIGPMAIWKANLAGVAAVTKSTAVASLGMLPLWKRAGELRTVAELLRATLARSVVVTAGRTILATAMAGPAPT